MREGRKVYINGGAQAAACEVCVFRERADDGQPRCALEKCVCGEQEDEAAYG